MRGVFDGSVDLTAVEPYMAAHKKPGFALTLDQYAELYRCSVNTVAGWRSQGAPLDTPAALVSWLVRRRGNQPLPRGLQALFRHKGGLEVLQIDFCRLSSASS